MQNAKQTKMVKIVTVTVAAVLFLVVTVLVFQFVQISSLKSKEALLQSKLDQLEQSIVTYSNENDYLSSADFVEDYAREVLGYGSAGETRFR